MATTIEERLVALEQQVAMLASQEQTPPPKGAWWKKLVGAYKDDPEFLEAERLGREYRESLRPRDSD